MNRKKIATIALAVGLALWVFLFAVDIARMAPDLFDADRLLEEGLTKENIISRQVAVVFLFAFVFPPVFVVGVFFLWNVYRLIRGGTTRGSVVCRSISVLLSFLIPFSARSVEWLARVLPMDGNTIWEILLFAAPAVIVLDTVLTVASGRLEKRPAAEP